MTEQVLAHLDEVWSSLEELCSELTPEEWSRPTDLAGWTVQDNLAHICGIESKWLGHKQPAPLEKPWPAHVGNDLAAINEAQIEARRSLAPEDVLTEFYEVTAERLKMLADLTPAEWDAETKGVMGMAPLREIIAIRLLDCFYHEQDIRRATGHPGALDTAAARFVFERLSGMLPMIIAKRAGVNDGASTVIEITGPIEAKIAVKVDGGRGTVLKEVPTNPTTRMRMDTETFFCAMGGRKTAEELSKGIVVDGVANFANQILAAMPITP